MIWVLGVLCALALVALFFPFVFWIDFSAGLDGVCVHLFFFKKTLYTYKKKFGKEVPSEKAEPPSEKEDVPSEKENAPSEKVDTLEEVAKVPVSVEKADAPKQAEPEETSETELTAPKVEQEKERSEETVDKTETAPKVDSEVESEVPEKKKPETMPESREPVAAEEPEKKTDVPDDEETKKRSLSDKEFWTLLLTPEFDTRAWWAVRHEMSALFRLFRVRFVGCFVEGFRMEYQHMGYAAALNGFLKSYPYIGDWDFRMDWTYDHEPRTEGRVRFSVNLCRVLGLFLTTLFYGGVMAYTFWRRRAHILKTGELPELGFIRNKIMKMMSEDD